MQRDVRGAQDRVPRRSKSGTLATEYNNSVQAGVKGTIPALLVPPIAANAVTDGNAHPMPEGRLGGTRRKAGRFVFHLAADAMERIRAISQDLNCHRRVAL